MVGNCIALAQKELTVKTVHKGKGTVEISRNFEVETQNLYLSRLR